MSKRYFSDKEIASNKLLKELQRRGLKKISETKSFLNKADNYERAVYNYLLYKYKYPEYFVEFDAYIEGKDNIKRQVDVAIYKAPDFKKPFKIAEAKRWESNSIQLGHIDEMIGKMFHLEINHGIYVSVKFSNNAKKHANNSNIESISMTFEEADYLNAREIIRSYFIIDFSFHPQMADALIIVLESKKNLTPIEIWDTIEILEDIYYEEWLAWFNDIKKHDFNKAVQILLIIAENHHESGWRYNALQLLEDIITEDSLQSLLEKETDPETIELIKNQLGMENKYE